MRFGFIVILFCLLGTILNESLVRAIAPAGITPDFAAILTVVIALYHFHPLGVLSAFLVGLVADFSSAQYIGPNAAGCVLAFCTVGLIANRMYAEKWIALIFITLGSSVVKAGTYFLFLSIYFPGHTGDGLQRLIIGESLVTALLAPFVIGAVRRRAIRPASFGKTMQASKSSSGASTGARWSPSSGLHWT